MGALNDKPQNLEELVIFLRREWEKQIRGACRNPALSPLELEFECGIGHGMSRALGHMLRTFDRMGLNPTWPEPPAKIPPLRLVVNNDKARPLPQPQPQPSADPAKKPKSRTRQKRNRKHENE